MEMFIKEKSGTSGTTFFVSMWPSVPSHAQTYLDLPMMSLVGQNAVYIVKSDCKIFWSSVSPEKMHLQRDSLQGNETSEIANFRWTWPDLLCQAWSCQDLPMVFLDNLREYLD